MDEKIIETVISAFLYLTLLSVIGATVAQILGDVFSIPGKGRQVISTLFCFFIVVGWDIGLFTLLFGEPKVNSGMVLFGIDWKVRFFGGVDTLGTSLIAGSGSGMVSDTFRMLVEKLKEWRAIASLTKEAARGSNDSMEKITKLKSIHKTSSGVLSNVKSRHGRNFDRRA